MLDGKQSYPFLILILNISNENPICFLIFFPTNFCRETTIEIQKFHPKNPSFLLLKKRPKHPMPSPPKPLEKLHKNSHINQWTQTNLVWKGDPRGRTREATKITIDSKIDGRSCQGKPSLNGFRNFSKSCCKSPQQNILIKKWFNQF